MFFWLTILVKCPAKSLVAFISSLLLVDNDEKKVSCCKFVCLGYLRYF